MKRSSRHLRTGLFIAVLACAFAGNQPAMAQIASQDELRTELRLRGEVPEARAMYREGQEAELAGRDEEAIHIYNKLLELYPNMIEALNGLAYLQATSANPRVRNPKEAVSNGERLMVMALQRWVQRRRFRPPDNVKQPFINLPLASSFYKVTILNTLAAAYAASGRFHAPPVKGGAETVISTLMQQECTPDATSLATMAFENAQSLADKYKDAELKRLLKSMEDSLRTIQSGHSIHGQQLRFTGTS
jgi:tetratricopeptide (TPR) repeat protein